METTEDLGKDIHKFEIEATESSGVVKKAVKVEDSGRVRRHYDASGKVIKNELIPVGYESTDDLIKAAKADPNIAKNMGYSSPETLEETIRNTERYLNTEPIEGNFIKNSPLAGEIKSVTKNGKVYDIEFDELGFPKFQNSDAFIKGGEVNLLDNFTAEELQNMKGSKHMSEASKMLQKKIDSGELDLESLLKEQGYNKVRIKEVLTSLKKEKSSLNRVLTWHPHQETGKMILVRYDVHKAVGHTGGSKIWGSGIH